MAGPLLSVIMPVYNERVTLREIVRRVQAAPVEKEIIAVDDCSTDGSSLILDQLAAQYPNFKAFHQPRNQGKGAAIRRAIENCQGEIILIQDADLEYNPAEYPQLLQPILDGKADVVYGSRFTGSPRRVLLFWHQMGNNFLTLLSNMFSNLNLTDMETCYKVFRAEVLKRVKVRSNRFGFEPEVTAQVSKMKCRIYEVPISYHGRDYTEGKKINWKDGVAALWTILRSALTPLEEDEPKAGTPAALPSTKKFNRWVYETIAPDLGGRILEVGARQGNMTTHLLSRELVVATETNPAHLEFLRHRFELSPNVVVRPLDLERLDPEALRNLEPDTVVCLNMLEFVERDLDGLRSFHALLPPGGRLVLLVSSRNFLSANAGGDSGLGHLYTRRELEEKLEAAGFTIRRVQHFNAAGALGWWVNSRLLGRKVFSAFQMRLYHLLLPLFRMERWLRLPFGLSLIAVAEKTAVAERLARPSWTAQAAV